MRKTAGSFPRGKKIRLLMWGMMGAGSLLGLSAGLLFSAVEPWIGPFGLIVLYTAAASAVYFAVRALDRPSSRWNVDNLIKGERAEARVGQAIEYAIAARNCAVAHSVTDIAKVGDIDHIVATPAAIWVIETKYKKVPSDIYPEVLRRIAANTEAVRKWAPAGRPVRGCLVLAYEPRKFKPSALAGQEKIAVYTEKTLGDFRRQLREEARGEKLRDEQIATAVWNLDQGAA